MILKSHKYVKVKVKDYSDRGVSLSNLPTEKLVSDLLNFWPNDVLIVTVCPVNPFVKGTFLKVQWQLLLSQSEQDFKCVFYIN